MDTDTAYILTASTLGFFGYFAYQAVSASGIDDDSYLSARGTQDLSLIHIS